jgi:hypothetical protein
MRVNLKAISLSIGSSLAVLAIGLPGIARGAAIGQLTNEIFHSSGSDNFSYTNASSIPVSSTDLIEGLAPTAADLVPIGASTGPATDYVGSDEATGGTTAPMTDGTTGVGNDDPTSATNSLFDFNINGNLAIWYIVYTLPSPTTLSNIVVTTGHADDRRSQFFDILVSTDGKTYTSLSDDSSQTTLNSPGTGFSYVPSTDPQLGGAAQSEVVPVAGQPDLGENIKYVEFVAMDIGEDVYRELDVNGSSTTVPLPSAAWGGLLLLAGLGARRMHRSLAPTGDGRNMR